MVRPSCRLTLWLGDAFLPDQFLKGDHLEPELQVPRQRTHVIDHLHRPLIVPLDIDEYFPKLPEIWQLLA